MPRKSKKIGPTLEAAAVVGEATLPLTPGRLYTSEAASLFAFAGRAYLTARSARTGARFTYKIRQGDNPGFMFVHVLTGPENSTDYAYLGYYRDGEYRHGGRKARVGADAPAAVAFDYLARALRRPGALPDALELFHDGRCGACARRLTVPESIVSGFGPECRERLGLSRIVCDDPLEEILSAA